MERKLFEKQLNELSIIADDFTTKHQNDYKFDVLKKCLETLQSANLFVEIPYELLEKVDKIFNLIPNHERYFVKVDDSTQKEYLKLIVELEENVTKNYIGKVDNIRKHLKLLAGNLSGIFLIYSFLSKFVANRYEIIKECYEYIFIGLISLSIALFLYQRINWLRMRYSKIY